MEYDRLVREAWALTWRYRSLWVLGLFAGGGAGASCSWSGGRPEPDGSSAFQPWPPGFQTTAEEVMRWIEANLGLIVTVAIVLAVIALAAFVVSFIAQGGMARASADGAAGRRPTLGQAWAAGINLFWRYVGLWLAVVIAVIVVGGAVAASVALLAGVMDEAAPARVIALLLLVLPLLAIGVALAVGVGIVVPFAQRAIAIEDVGPLAALRDGWLLLRTHLGTSLLVWVLSIALGILAGVAIAIAMIAALVPIGIVGAVAWAATGWSALTIGYIVVAALALLVALIVAAAVANTFFWHYWTLAYLRLAHPPALAVAGSPLPPGPQPGS